MEGPSGERRGPGLKRLLPPLLALAAARAAWRLYHQLPLPFRAAGEAHGAFDLHLRWREVHAWFAGDPFYGPIWEAVYPPATYAILWPVLGWASWPVANALWFALSVAAAAALALLLARECAGRDREGLSLALLLVPAAYGTGITILMGQMGLVVLLAVTAGVLVAVRSGDLRHDLLAAALFLPALAKPSIAAPFFWLLLFLPRRLRPALLAAAGYLAVTAAAAAARPESIGVLLAGWRANLGQEVDRLGGYGNLVNVLASLGRVDLALPATAGVLALVGLFVWARRDADPWTLLGATALVTRLFTYHRIYDDVLVILPMAALLRLVVRRESPAGRRPAALVLGLLFAAQLLPFDLARLPAARAVFHPAQVASWLVALAFLVAKAWEPSERPGADALAG